MNKCTKVLRNAKQQYLKKKLIIADTKNFWKTVKSLFSNKSKTANQSSIILHKNNRIIKPISLNGKVFVYKLSSFGFQSRCCHLSVRYRTCFEQGVPAIRQHSDILSDIQATIECRFTLKRVCDMIITYNHNKKISHTLNKYFKKLSNWKKIPALKSLKHLLRHFKNHSIKKNTKYFNSKKIFTFRKFKETKINTVVTKKQSQDFQKYSSKHHGKLRSYLFSGTHKHFQRLCK